MAEIIECVPNFSTSDPESVHSILNEPQKTKNVSLLNYSFHDYYNRPVVSFIGDKKSVLEAALKMAFKAVELIDIAGYYLKIGNLNEKRVLEIAIHNAVEKGGLLE